MRAIREGHWRHVLDIQIRISNVKVSGELIAQTLKNFNRSVEIFAVY